MNAFDFTLLEQRKKRNRRMGLILGAVSIFVFCSFLIKTALWG